MRLDLFLKLKCESRTIYNTTLVLDTLCVTYFPTSITMPDPQTGDMRQMW